MNKETAQIFLDMLERINQVPNEFKEQEKGAILYLLKGYVLALLEDQSL